MSSTESATREAMDPTFAVFNLHVNKAGEKADAEFVRMFGADLFEEHIKPAHDNGVMSIFAMPENEYRLAWIAMVTVLVNEVC